ncbi:unnamed protein product, partial [Linum tenue]
PTELSQVVAYSSPSLAHIYLYLCYPTPLSSRQSSKSLNLPNSTNPNRNFLEKMIPCKLIVSLALSLCLLAPLIQAADFRYCDKKSDSGDVTVNGVEITPDPITRGKPATFTIKATADKAFSGGKLVIDVSYFIFHVYSETKNLCDETSCPVSTGEFVVSHSQILPGVTPPVSFLFFFCS